MTRFSGQVRSGPERRDGRWYFSIWNVNENKGINCISSTRFEADNRDVSLVLAVHDEVEVVGEVQLPGTCFFDHARVRKKN
jgi:hypothetical protein